MSTVVPPPSYSNPSPDVIASNNTGSINDSDNLLPTYSASPRRAPISTRPLSALEAQPKEFNYDAKKGKFSAEMTIFADGNFSKNIPTFLEGQPVKGRVKLLLDKPDSFQLVIVHVQGQVITGANQGEQLTFIDITQALWSQAHGDPRNSAANFVPPSSNSTSTSSRDTPASPSSNAPSPPVGNPPSTSPAALAAAGLPPKFTGKLPEGEYTWEFSIDIPKEVVLPSGPPLNEPQVFHPPQTFNERHSRASVVYQVSVKFCKNKLFQTDHRIFAAFGYIPVIRPPPFPPLRRLAYEEGSPLLGPSVDPDGWKALEPIRIRGKIFNNRQIELGCTMFLAKPLCYTRGTVIPLCIELQCEDAQAVDLLSSPKAIVVRLRRRIKYHHNAQTIDSLAWRDSIDHSQLAAWWPSSEGSESKGAIQRRRFVNGELHLRHDVKPTSLMAHFRIEYSVVLFPFDTAGFEGSEDEQLLEEPVEVVTAFAPGPRPTMSAPPGYESDALLMQQASNTFFDSAMI